MLSAKEAEDDVSSMSRMLLQGWAMLELSCISCRVPLMRKRGEENTYCVHCKQTFGKDGKPVAGQGVNDPTAPPSIGKDHTASPAGAPLTANSAGSPDLQEFRQMRGHTSTIQHSEAPSTDDPAAALAQKMLEGWALLGVHCPRCSHPLVRNRERKMWCVGCKVWVLSEEEAAAANVKPSPKLTTEQPPVQLTVAGAAATTPPPTSPVNDQEPGSGEAAASKLSVMEVTVLSVKEKMAEAAQALSRTPASQAGVADCLQYVQLIRECCSTLGELSDLQAKHPRLS